MFDASTTSPSVLAGATGLTRGAISKLIERLVQKDFVSRAEAAGDRRFQDVCLTSAGRILVHKLAALADQNDREFFSQLSVGKRDRLVATQALPYNQRITCTTSPIHLLEALRPEPT